AGTIAAHFPVSRPAISRHLRVLREAGLVVARLDSRHWRYRVAVERLQEVDAWLAPYREAGQPASLIASPGIWSSRLDALDTEVHRTRRASGQAASGAIPLDEPTRQEEEHSA
ncbi:MAG: helix-turn-helix domain-containing protein, partial [Thermomicrobiales bacterium]